MIASFWMCENPSGWRQLFRKSSLTLFQMHLSKIEWCVRLPILFSTFQGSMRRALYRVAYIDSQERGKFLSTLILYFMLALYSHLQNLQELLPKFMETCLQSNFPTLGTLQAVYSSQLTQAALKASQQEPHWRFVSLPYWTLCSSPFCYRAVFCSPLESHSLQCQRQRPTRVHGDQHEDLKSKPCLTVLLRKQSQNSEHSSKT